MELPARKRTIIAMADDGEVGEGERDGGQGCSYSQ